VTASVSRRGDTGRARRWTAGEDQVLRRLYPEGVPIADIGRQLGRSEEAVSERRRALGMAPRPRSRPWSEREDRLVRAAALSGVPAEALAGTLRRTPEQVRRRRRVLVGAEARPRPYTPADDALIREAWGPDVDVLALARRLGRSPGSLRSHAAKLGCHRPAPRPRWSAAEDAAVRDGYELGLTCAEIALGLPGRTASAVVARAAKLGLASYARVWTAADDRRLRTLAESGTDVEQAARVLARTPEALRARARKLGLLPLRSTRARARRPARRWTATEDDQLRLHVGVNPAVLAQLLDRSPEAVAQRLRRLGLRDARRRSPHHLVPARRGLTPGQLATVVRELRDGGPRRRLRLAQRLGLSPAQLSLEESYFRQ
jgi:hypothetical protein